MQNAHGRAWTRFGGRFWATWCVAHVVLLMLTLPSLPASSKLIAQYVTVWYPPLIGAIQAVLVWPLVRGTWRPSLVVAGSAAFMLFSPTTDAAMARILSAVAMRLAGGNTREFDDAFTFLPLGGGVVAGLLVWWVLSARWRRAWLLVGVHPVLALLASLTAGELWPGQFRNDFAVVEGLHAGRIAVSGGFGLLVAVATGAVICLLQPRTIPVVDAPPRPPATVRPTLTGFAVVLWFTAHVVLFVALNLFVPSVPMASAFAALGYAPTVGVMQALLLRSQCAPDSRLWRGWLLPTLLLPPVGAILSVVPLMILYAYLRPLGVRPFIGNSPAGFPIIDPLTSFYGISLGAGLALGLIHWWQLRRYSRGAAWSRLYVVALTVGPAIMSAAATRTVEVVLGQPQLRASALDGVSLVTVLGAVVGGLAVALIVGAAAWLLVRPVYLRAEPAARERNENPRSSEERGS